MTNNNGDTQFKLFTSMAMAAFKNAHPSLPIPHEELWGDVLEAFSFNPDADYTDEIKRFIDWIPTWKFAVVLPSTDRISVTLQVPFMGGYVNIGLQAGFAITFGENGIPETEASQQLINATTVDLFRKTHAAYQYLKNNAELGALPETKPPMSVSQTPQSQQNGTTEQFQATEMVVNVTDGVKQVRIKAGWFMQYGAPCYEEVLTAAGIDLNTLAVGKHQFNRRVTVQKNSAGKPKIIRID